MTTTPPIIDTARQEVVAELEQHVGAGRLSLDEFADRARAAYQARTRRELTDLTRDLPPQEPDDAPAPRRRLTPLIAVAVLALLLGGTLVGTADAMAPWMTQMAQGCH